jgi:hypothetical protein
MKLTIDNVSAVSIGACALASGLAASAFLLATLLGGDYDWVARLGGAAWVWLLSMIILMPILIPLFRERAGAPPPEPPPAHH